GLHTYISLKFPLLDAAGQTYAVAGISTDITESKRAEAERERLLKIIETSKDFIAMATPEGKGTYLNPGGLKMTGYTADEFYGGMSIADFQPTLPREALETAVKEGSWSGEAAFVAKDGREILTSQVITALKDDDGNLQGFSTIARDISEQKKAEELATVAEVSTIVSGILDTQEMLQLVVDLIKERFNLYHSHIYLLDEISENLTLAAGAGEVGRQMVTEGWQIPLDREQSLVARAARTRQGVIINDVRAEPGFLPNPLLPHAAAELAAPLIVGEQVLGVLDVQADEINRFTQEDINVQNTLSSQIAVALQNARRHEQTEVALNELTRLQRIMTREGWQVFMTSAERPFDGYLAGRDAVHPIVQAQPNDGNGAAGDGAVTTIASLTAGDTSITAPMTVRGVTIGGLGLRDPSGQPVSAENREFLEALSRQVADALEQARLVEETQKASFLLGERVKELNCLNDIGHKMEETPPVDEFLQWVAERIPPAMQYPDICVAAIELEDQVYGVPEVLNLPCKIMGGIRVGGELVGGVHIAYTEERDFLDEESALVGGVVRYVSGYIENQRLIEQTQAALDETATLYTGSERVVRAPTTGDILLALVESTVIQQFDRANIMFFDEVWDDTPPDGFSVSAVWERSGEPSRAPAGTHYSRAQVPFLSVIERDKPFFIHDVVTDTHVDENTRAVLTRLGMRSLTIFPLVAGEQWIGALTVQGSTPIEITENQIRQIE
ncbi:MAG: GAF domain-containing protein, partial [Anaerolineales bacterium]